VASTLGRNRWGELRDAYLEIADNREVSVRRSLAASLGEMAKIIGEANAERDLLGVWWDAVRSEEEDIREKAMECITAFVAALAKEPRLVVVNGLLTLWEEGIFRGWRERKVIAKALTGLTKSVGHDIPKVVRGLLRKALEDSVSAVREAAVSAVSSNPHPARKQLTVAQLPHIWCMFADQDGVLADLRDDIRALSESEIYRQRMTYVLLFFSFENLSENDSLQIRSVFTSPPS
jgi:serine/threonine-protein phosphatase 4 regulatory subunit 1